MPPDARRALVAAADRLLDGDWEVLGAGRPDVVDPDWFLDPVTGRRAPDAVLAFRIDHRDEAVTGNVKSVWELSRHHHLTVLAAAWWLTSDPRYAEVVAAQLRSWWRRNPFLSGIHWTSGIELGVRLTSWVWIRRLLHDWPGVADLFEENPDALAPDPVAPGVPRRVPQPGLVRQQPCDRRGGGAARGRLRLSVVHGERGVAAGRVTRAGAGAARQHVPERGQPGAGHRLPPLRHRAGACRRWSRPTPPDTRSARPPARSLVSSLDAAAAMLDVRGNPPRQGDGDEGRALVLDDPEADPWAVLLACGASTVGPSDWWPSLHPGVLSTLLGAVGGSEPTAGRPSAGTPGVSRRRPLPAAHSPRRGAGDLVPLRRRAARLPLHRRTRPRRRPGRRGAARRRGAPRGSGHLLLPR